MDNERNSMVSGICENDLNSKEQIENINAKVISEYSNNEKRCEVPLSKEKNYSSLLSDEDFYNLLARNEEYCLDNKLVYPYNNLTCSTAFLLARMLKNNTTEQKKQESFCSYYTDNKCDDVNIVSSSSNINGMPKKLEFHSHNSNHLIEWSTLATIDISYNSIHLQGAIALFNALRNNTSLHSLDLSGNALTESSESDKLIELQANAGSVDNTDLEEGNAEVGSDLHHCFNESLKQMLWHNNTFTHLYLNNSSLGVTQLISLFYGLKSNVALRVLHLARPTFMSAECMKYVVSHLKDALIERTEYIANAKLTTDCGDSEPNGLVELNLSFFGIENDHLQTLLPGLQMTPSLQTLLLRGNRLCGEDGGKVLCELLRSHTVALKCLDVGANAIKGAGATYLADGVNAHPSLQIIRFDCNKITQKGMMALVTALGSCANIREVKLWGNDALTEQCVIDALATTCDAMQWDGNVQLDFGLSNGGNNHYTIFKM